MSRHKPTWILVADGGKAFALSDAEQPRVYIPVPGFTFTGPNLRDRDVGSDKPGRAFQAAGSSRRSAVAEAGTLVREEERAFLGTVLAALAQAHAEHRFSRLIVAAEPRAMGQVRAMLPAALASALAGEVPADFVRMPTEEIGPHVLARLAAAGGRAI